MASRTVPFSENLQLGRAVNLHSMTYGPYLAKEDGNTILTDLNIENISSSIVTDVHEIKTQLKIGGKLSLHLDLGMDVVGGFEDRYHNLSSSLSKEGSLAVLISANTVVKSFQEQASWLNSNWKKLTENMTHYVSSVTYGGYLDIIFEMSKSSFMTDEEIKGALSVALPMLSLGFEGTAETTGSSSAADENLKMSLSGTSIKLKHQPRSISEVRQLIDDFLANVKTGNDGKGTPLTCTLLPLSALDASVARPEDTEMESILPKVKQILDDITRADALLKMVSDYFIRRLQESEKQEIEKLQDNLEEAKQSLRNALMNSKPDELKQICKELRDKNGLGGFIQVAQSLVISFARDSIPNDVLNNVKEMIGYASWHAANTRIGYLSNALADIKTVEEYFYNVCSSEFFSERFCATLRSMALAAAWHAANSCFPQQKEEKGNKRKFEACRTKLISLFEVTEEVVDNLQNLCWNTAWYTAFTRIGNEKEASKCTTKMEALIQKLKSKK